MDHLRLVASQSECNKMTPQNVAICFGPVLMLHSEIGRTDIDFHKPISVLKYLLTIWPPKSGNVCDAIHGVETMTLNRGDDAGDLQMEKQV